MSATRRLIVNADDFGRTAGINRGVIEAHRRGVVTSATLMVTYPSAPEAAALAREAARLGLGLHLALSGGPPALPPEAIPSLVDSAGRLPASPEGLRGAEPGEIAAEARAQLERFRRLVGRPPTHFDTHHHSHRLPAVFDATVALARETGRPVRSESPETRERLRAEGIATTDGFLETFFGEAATFETLDRLLRALPAGTTELMCHPAVVDDELRESSSYAEPRRRELEVLTDPRVRRRLEDQGIALVHFGAL